MQGVSPLQAEFYVGNDLDAELALEGSPDSGGIKKAYELLKSAPDSLLREDWMGLFAARLRDWSQVDRWSRRVDALRRTNRSGRDTLLVRDLRAEARLFRSLAAQRRGELIVAVNEMRAALHDEPINSFWRTDMIMRWEIGHWLLAMGDLRGAERYLQSLNMTDWLKMPALVEYDLGRIAEQLGNREQARYHYARMVRWWEDADPELKPLWEEGRRALARVTAEQ
jgi:tetratricopeptide (TPR) repeat protein